MYKYLLACYENDHDCKVSSTDPLGFFYSFPTVFEVIIRAGALKRDKVRTKGCFSVSLITGELQTLLTVNTQLLDNVHKQIDVDLKVVQVGGSGALKPSIVG